MTRIQPPSPSDNSAEKREAAERRLRVAETQAVLGKGYSASPTYSSYNAMLHRCYKAYTNGFKNYGGRGITVCERWRESYLDFFHDMGERPAGKVLDRREVNGNYEPENCRWVTRVHSIRNKRNVSVSYIEGESKADRKRRTGRQWSLNNREKINARQRVAMLRRYHANPEVYRKRQMAYYRKNRERLIAEAKARYWERKNKITVTSLAARD